MALRGTRSGHSTVLLALFILALPSRIGQLAADAVALPAPPAASDPTAAVESADVGHPGSSSSSGGGGWTAAAAGSMQAAALCAALHGRDGGEGAEARCRTADGAGGPSPPAAVNGSHAPGNLTASGSGAASPMPEPLQPAQRWQEVLERVAAEQPGHAGAARLAAAATPRDLVPPPLGLLLPSDDALAAHLLSASAGGCAGDPFVTCGRGGLPPDALAALARARVEGAAGPTGGGASLAGNGSLAGEAAGIVLAAAGRDPSKSWQLFARHALSQPQPQLAPGLPLPAAPAVLANGPPAARPPALPARLPLVLRTVAADYLLAGLADGGPAEAADGGASGGGALAFGGARAVWGPELDAGGFLVVGLDRVIEAPAVGPETDAALRRAFGLPEDAEEPPPAEGGGVRSEGSFYYPADALADSLARFNRLNAASSAAAATSNAAYNEGSNHANSLLPLPLLIPALPLSLRQLELVPSNASTVVPRSDAAAEAAAGGGAGTAAVNVSSTGAGSNSSSISNDPPPAAGEEDLAFSTVFDLAAKLRSGAVSTEELRRLFAERLRRLGPALRAVVSFTADGASAASEHAVDASLPAGQGAAPDSSRAPAGAGAGAGAAAAAAHVVGAPTGEARRAGGSLLEGIPYGLKDVFFAPGTATSWGVASRANATSNETSWAFEALSQRAGAVLLAKLATGELAWGDTWFGGATRSPWDPGSGSCGSSAGPAAAVVAGLLPFAIGTETWGSVLCPAVTTGATAFRPTGGHVPQWGALQVSPSLDKTGVFCRQALDCAAVARALGAQPQQQPSSAVPAAPPPFATADQLRAVLASEAPPPGSAEPGRNASSSPPRALSGCVGFLDDASQPLLEALRRAVPGVCLRGPLPAPPGVDQTEDVLTVILEAEVALSFEGLWRWHPMLRLGCRQQQQRQRRSHWSRRA